MMQAAAVAREPAGGAVSGLLPDPGLAALLGCRDDERLAVYDWMVPDGPEAQLLADPAASWIEAGIRGDFYESRWGSAAGLRLRSTAPPLAFRIVCSRLLPRRLPILDAWASPNYRRVTAEADHRGSVVRTQIYVLKETGLY